ncbi:MAG: hypothetical protein ABS75_21610 [Pelagibacterium sp. SCN 63-23]|nr:MAG: hypothetical protein ABS75_21610 [Pelagibacterium sp. SCN 63-23]
MLMREEVAEIALAPMPSRPLLRPDVCLRHPAIEPAIRSPWSCKPFWASAPPISALTRAIGLAEDPGLRHWLDARQAALRNAAKSGRIGA